MPKVGRAFFPTIIDETNPNNPKWRVENPPYTGFSKTTSARVANKAGTASKK